MIAEQGGQHKNAASQKGERDAVNQTPRDKSLQAFWQKGEFGGIGFCAAARCFTGTFDGAGSGHDLALKCLVIWVNRKGLARIDYKEIGAYVPVIIFDNS